MLEILLASAAGTILLILALALCITCIIFKYRSIAEKKIERRIQEQAARNYSKNPPPISQYKGYAVPIHA